MKTAAAAATAAAWMSALTGARAFLVGVPSATTVYTLHARSSWAGGNHITAAQQQQKQLSCPMSRGAATALSMVSTTFGEKINTDRVVLDKTAAEAIAEEYPEALVKNPGFLGEVGHGETRTFSEEELRRRLEVAHIFVKMANLILLSRGRNVMAEDFKYYSPGTGRLDRDAFLRLTKTLDVGFSNFRIDPTDFVVFKDGVVSYRRTFKALHDGYLNVGDKTYPPTQTKVVSDVDLCTVSFDDWGIVKSYSFGLMVEVVYAIEDPEALAEIEAIKKRVTNQEAKMISLAGQESSIAYCKSKADIDTMMMDMEVLLERVNSAPNTEGLGGIPGLFAAVGAEFPKDLTNLEGDDAYGEIGGLRAASFSFPVEVKEYEGFDEDTFKEMK